MKNVGSNYFVRKCGLDNKTQVSCVDLEMVGGFGVNNKVLLC